MFYDLGVWPPERYRVQLYMVPAKKRHAAICALSPDSHIARFPGRKGPPSHERQLEETELVNQCACDFLFVHASRPQYARIWLPILQLRSVAVEFLLSNTQVLYWDSG